MKKITFKLMLGVALLLSAIGNAQCLTAIEGQYPDETITATDCNGITETLIVDDAWAGEYSVVAVTAGETYTFRSSIATDYLTISSDDGATAAISGITPLTWVADVTGEVRFYTHTDAACGEEEESRDRAFTCGIAPCSQPVGTFAITPDCGNASFSVTANITDLGTATTITVTDDQGSAAQTIDSTGSLTFGPYAFGTEVELTATNDDTPVCNITSGGLVITACPPTNDLCADAVVLNCGDTLSAQTTDGATGGSETSCVGTIGDDIWYSFAGNDEVNTLTATATNGEGPQIEVYESTDGTCAGFVEGDCLVSAGSGDTVTSVSFASATGKTYYVHIGNWINGFPAVAFDLALTCTTPPTAPANDDSCGAYAIIINPDASCGSVTAGTLSGATASAVDADACGGTEDDDVWFSFVASETAHSVSLTNIAGSTTDLFHSLWTGDCTTGLTLVPNTCSDDESSAPAGLTVGQTYYIRVYSYTDVALQNSTFDVCVGILPPAPENDTCDGATLLACGDVLTGQTTEAATGGTGTSCIGTIGNDLWYTFVGTGEVTTLQVVSTNTEGPQLEVFESTDGTCAGFTPGTCFASDGTGDETVTVSFTSTLGTTYYAHVGNWINGDPGVVYDLSLTCSEPPTTPDNDECSNPAELTVGNTFNAFPVIGSTAAATTTAGLTPTCQTDSVHDVWYTVTAPASGLLTIETDTTPGTLMTDSVVTVFTGDCGTLTQIGCNDDAGNGNFSKVDLTGLTPGTLLRIAVSTYGDAGDGIDGNFQISAYDVTLATSTFNAATFKAYPNPVTNVLNLSYDKNITAVTVFNLLGQEVMTKALNSNLSQIDMSHLSAGTYMVKVSADNQVQTIKVVKQ